jgi:hypothetical protein
MVRQSLLCKNDHSIFNKELMVLFFISKVLTVLLIVGFYGQYDPLHDLNSWNRWYFPANLHTILLPFANWDGQHYLMLSDLGYNFFLDSRAFFPLYPLTIRVLNLVSNSPYLSAFILNTIFSYLFFGFYYKYAIQYFDKENVIKSLALILCFPATFFLTVFYAEALFLFLIFAFLYYYDVRKSYLSLVFAFLLPLTKGQALYVLLSILVLILIRFLKKEKMNYKYEASNLFAFFIGGITYFAFFYFVTGNGFSGIEAQNNFAFNFKLSHVINIPHFVEYLFSPSQSLFSFNNSLVDKLFIMIALLLIFLTYESKRKEWFVFYLMFSYPIASLGTGGSFIRFSLLLIPFFSLAFFSYRDMGKVVFCSICTVLAVIQLFFIYRFSMNFWVG